MAAGSRELNDALREIDRLNEQLDTLREEVIWANRLTTLGTMAAVLAHEYNNLLTPIGSYAQFALNNPEDAELTSKALNAAVDGVRQAQAVAKATLAFARPDDAQDSEPGCVQQAIAQAMSCLEKPLKQRKIRIDIDTQDATTALATVQLQQVLVNLIDNARKALNSCDGPKRLRVAGEVDGQGGYLLTVQDNGPGITAEKVSKIFDAFVTQAHAGKTDKGTGLGLRVCKDLVEQAGGWIRAESEPGVGTTMRVWLPTSGA